jgi:hypothetical protein
MRWFPRRKREPDNGRLAEAKARSAETDHVIRQAREARQRLDEMSSQNHWMELAGALLGANPPVRR